MAGYVFGSVIGDIFAALLALFCIGILVYMIFRIVKRWITKGTFKEEIKMGMGGLVNFGTKNTYGKSFSSGSKKPVTPDELGSGTYITMLFLVFGIVSIILFGLMGVNMFVPIGLTLTGFFIFNMYYSFKTGIVSAGFFGGALAFYFRREEHPIFFVIMMIIQFISLIFCAGILLFGLRYMFVY